MIWLWVVGIVVVIGVVAVIAAGRDVSMAEVYEDRPDNALPAGRPLSADDVEAVRFTTAVRGYRMDEVDAFLDRVRDQLASHQPAADTAERPLHSTPHELDTLEADSVGPDSVHSSSSDGVQRSPAAVATGATAAGAPDSPVAGSSPHLPQPQPAPPAYEGSASPDGALADSDQRRAGAHRRDAPAAHGTAEHTAFSSDDR